MNVNNLRIRDPFILTDEKNRCYYMYGTTDFEENGISAKNTFWGYKSNDLIEFSEPVVLLKEENFWAEYDFWAAEVHFYKGHYYLFGSLKSSSRPRGTQIFVSDSPLGQFRPVSSYPITPNDWECLDGTFYEENGVPYIIFCREWVEVENGEIYAMQLSSDLTRAVGNPTLLFKAGDQPLAQGFMYGNFTNAKITDGPFVRKENDELILTWSSNSSKGYAVFTARSSSICGQWKHDKQPLFDSDGGHCMIFRSLEGKKLMAYHSPNRNKQERLKLKEL